MICLSYFNCKYFFKNHLGFQNLEFFYPLFTVIIICSYVQICWSRNFRYPKSQTFIEKDFMFKFIIRIVVYERLITIFSKKLNLAKPRQIFFYKFFHRLASVFNWIFLLDLKILDPTVLLVYKWKISLHYKQISEICGFQIGEFHVYQPNFQITMNLYVAKM